MTSVPSQPGRVVAQRDALLKLSRLIAGAGKGGILDDALDVVLGGLGVTRGAIYKRTAAGLELVSHLGLPRSVRPQVEQVEPSMAGLPVNKAAKTRKLVVDGDLIAASDGKLDPVLAQLGWVATASAPLLSGRDVIGVLVAAAPMRNPFTEDAVSFLETAANMIALVAFRRDDDDPRDLRSDGRKTAQVVALGMLAAGFVDDLRGPLGALKIQLREQERLLAELEGTATGLPAVAALVELTSEAGFALQRANQITARLLGVMHDGPPENVDVGALALVVLAELAPVLDNSGVTVQTQIDEHSVIVGRREEMAQLVTSLIGNALDACKGADARSRRMAVTVRQDGTRIALTVEDSGGGVAPDLRARIFDPFFSTKQGNLGLGLALVKHTALSHRGHIELAPSELGGALFRVVLPSAPEVGATEVQRRPSRLPLSSPAKPGERAPTILWVDDDEIFLRSIKRAFRDRDIVGLRTAAEADARLAEEPKPAIVFCDIGLPDRAGHILHRAVAERDPVLAKRFVFVTGGVITSDVADYLIASGCPTLLKPVSIDEIKSLLDGRTDGDDARSSVPTLREMALAPTVHPSRPPLVKRIPGGPANANSGAGERRLAPTNPEIPAARRRSIEPEAPDSKS